MGRHKTEAYIIDNLFKIELSYLVKHKLIQKGQILGSNLYWSDGNNISIISNYRSDKAYLWLYHSKNDNEGGTVQFKQRIELTSVKSNLGNGEILYFLCPVNNQKCKILYSTNTNSYFKSRRAFDKKIYYHSQIQSKNYYWTERHWELMKKLNSINKRGYKKKYNGKPTKISLRVDVLREKVYKYELKKENYFDWKCSNWTTNFFSLPKAYRDSITDKDWS